MRFVTWFLRTLVFLETSTRNSSLGSGRGVDHLVVTVRDLEASRNEYARVLGFNMSKGGRHPGGTENCVARFENGSYRELLGIFHIPNSTEARSRRRGYAVSLKLDSARYRYL